MNIANPISKKVLKTKVHDHTCVTKTGVFRYAIFFLVILVAGIFASLTVIPELTRGYAVIEVGGVLIAKIQVVMMVGSLVAALLSSVLATIFSWMAVPFGIVSCACYGIILGSTGRMIPAYREVMFLAMIITIAVVLCMIGLYSTNLVHVSNKFRRITRILMLTLVFASLITTVCCFIPLPEIQQVLSFIRENPLLHIGASVFGILVACMCLISDFDMVQRAVDQKISGKYEASLGFSIAFSVIWLYMKILDLLVELKKDHS